MTLQNKNPRPPQKRGRGFIPAMLILSAGAGSVIALTESTAWTFLTIGIIGAVLLVVILLAGRRR